MTYFLLFYVICAFSSVVGMIAKEHNNDDYFEIRELKDLVSFILFAFMPLLNVFTAVGTLTSSFGLIKKYVDKRKEDKINKLADKIADRLKDIRSL